MTRLLDDNLDDDMVEEPEYVDELFPAIDDAPQPWEEVRTVDELEGVEDEEPASPLPKRAIFNPRPANSRAQPPRALLSRNPTPPKRPATRLAIRPANPPELNRFPRPAEPPVPKRTPDPKTPTQNNGHTPQADSDIPPAPRPRPIKFSPTFNPMTAGIPRPVSAISLPKIGIKPADAVPAPTSAPYVEEMPAGPEAPARTPPIPSPAGFILMDVIREHQPLPSNAIILGIDEAGKPLVIDFADASVGALLILGEQPGDNEGHLRAILASAVALNKVQDLQIDVISENKERFLADEPGGSGHYRMTCTPEDDCAYEILGDYLGWVEERMRGGKSRPTRLLVLDGVDKLVSRLAPESLSFLRWIMRRGPAVNIWTMASLPVNRLDQFDIKTLHTFGLRLYGKITDLRLANRYTPIPPHQLKSLMPGKQACLKLDDQIIEFAIPRI